MNDLTMHELRRLRDYLRYVDVDAETLRNEILQLILNRGDIGISQKIDEECYNFFYGREYISLIDVTTFISNLDMSKISIGGLK